MKRSALLISGLFIACFCFSQKKEYKQAIYKNTFNSYKKYLEEFPDSKFSDEIRDRRDALCRESWDNIRNTEFLKTLNRFIYNCSGTVYEDSARQRREEMEWRWHTGGIEKLKQFMEKYPESVHYEEAKKRLITIRWNEVVKTDRRSAIDSFLLKFPESDYTFKADSTIAQMIKYALPRASKAGNIEEVKGCLPSADKDMRSLALMEAVWGLLHTNIWYKYNASGMLIIEKTKSSNVVSENYLKIISILLKNGADPERFAFADFASVEVREWEQRDEVAKYRKDLSEKGYGKLATSFGDSELSGLYVDYGTGGLSIEEVARIHEAQALLDLINK